MVSSLYAPNVTVQPASPVASDRSRRDGLHHTRGSQWSDHVRVDVALLALKRESISKTSDQRYVRHI